ncbi:unnamed protein product, partial [Effrenium voratum]
LRHLVPPEPLLQLLQRHGLRRLRGGLGVQPLPLRASSHRRAHRGGGAPVR